MTPARLAEIRDWWEGYGTDMDPRVIPELLAEVDRLRAALREVAATTADPDVFRTVVEAAHD